MSVEELKNIFNTNGEVKFKLFSLEYIIKKEENNVSVYATLYDNRKKYYNNIDEALNNYTIYNESIIDNSDRIQLVNKVGE